MLLPRKGYDICHPTGHIVVSFEPVNFNYYKDKWMIRNNYVGYDGPDYLVKITQKFLKSLKLDAETYMINSSVNSEYWRKKNV